MLNVKMPAYPLIVFDPLISVWSRTEKLYESETTMWTGEAKPIGGHIIVDDEPKRFMGIAGAENIIEQVNLEVSATSTKYTFRDDKVELRVTFTSHFLMNKPVLLSRPTAFIDAEVVSIDGEAHTVEVVFDFSDKLCYKGTKKLTRGGVLPYPDGRIVYMGKMFQKTLEGTGDQVSINWGWFYLAGQAKIIITSEQRKNAFFVKKSVKETKDYYRKVVLATRGDKVSPEKPLSLYLVPAYDDLCSMLYFCEYKRGYWTKENYDILSAIKDTIARRSDILAACKRFDERVENEAIALHGENYAKLLIAAFRQVIGSHKMIADGNDMVYLSKECGSNGCVGTVDVSYPSSPLFLWGCPEYVKGLLLPVFRNARLKNWVFDFAPHDVGQYPFATGQVYGATVHLRRIRNRWHFEMLRKHTCEQIKGNLYNFDKQMPIEESANMIIMTAAYFNETGDVALVNENIDLLGTWAEYLVKAGIQLENQLCTDDFAGHLEKNVNLAVKSVIAIALWGKLTNKIFKDKGDRFLKIAKKFASDLEIMADAGDRMVLALDDRKSWSLKYNMVWDKLFDLGLFSEETYKKEIAYYKSKCTSYGIPLDSRKDGTKSDWELWAAAMDDSGELTDMVCKALVKFLEETPDKVPFTDWYDAATGRIEGTFAARTVQGALFINLYKQKLKEKGGYLFDRPLGDE